LKKINFRVFPALEVIYGADKGRKFVLPYGGDHRIGRGENCNIRVNDPMVSSVHGTVAVSPEEVVYTDEGSRNGSILNNKIVNTHPLKHGDVLVLGNTKLKYTHPEQARHDRAQQAAVETIIDPEPAWRKYALWLLTGLAGALLAAALLYIIFRV
jgi:pSer/pThr/pTyr-binding forkhead associated (FHA) protein